jgi:hypothetical protein
MLGGLGDVTSLCGGPVCRLLSPSGGGADVGGIWLRLTLSVTTVIAASLSSAGLLRGLNK